MASSKRAHSRGNRILDRLPAKERERLAERVEDIALVAGDRLCDAGRKISHVYFPRQGVISLFRTSKDLPDVGVGIVGGEGMVGLTVAAGRSTSRLLAVAQGRGLAERIETKVFLDLLRDSPALRDAMFVYSDILSGQMARNAACMAMHPARTRLARWMLDITQGSRFAAFSSTQVDTATALGLQRPAVSYAASSLQTLGLIRYLRGEVTILDRRGLRAVACSCSAET